MSSQDAPYNPSIPWRLASTFAFAFTGLLSKAFTRFACTTEVTGLDGFLRLLDERSDVEGRRRGLITVSNHLCVIDDPLIWGVLPLRYTLNPANMRWALGSYDICFKNPFTSTYFSLGQVLPTHRLAHSVHGGLFQPTMTQCIRLLSAGPFKPMPVYVPPGYAPHKRKGSWNDSAFSSTDPFSSPSDDRALVPSDPRHYTTTGSDSFPSPTAYPSRRHSWIHIFPEGKVHQADAYNMRYFKWGIARLILESEPCPEVVPVWIEGFEEVMHEARTAPRWIPRFGQRVGVHFGESVAEDVWEGFRERWRRLREQVGEEGDVGVLTSEGLRSSDEAVKLRMEVTKAVREEVLKLRRASGWTDEDPKAGAVETYAKEGGKRRGRMDDGSWVGDT